MSEESIQTPVAEVETTVVPEKGKVFTESEVENLMKALKAERETRKNYEKEAKERAAQLERFANINPDEYAKLQEEVARAAQLQAQYGEAKEAIELKYSKQAEEAAARAEAAERRMQEYQKRYALEKVFFAAGGRTDAADGVSFFDMLADQLGGRFRQESDGSLTVVDLQGDPVLDKESGKRISPEEFVSSFKHHPIYGTFFKGTKGSGAGLGYGGTDVNGMPTEDLDSLDPDQLFQRAFS
jgi:hypothetical protein